MVDKSYLTNWCVINVITQKLIIFVSNFICFEAGQSNLVFVYLAFYIELSSSIICRLFATVLCIYTSNLHCVEHMSYVIIGHCIELP